MKDEERYKLLYGPYHPPRVRRGHQLFDEIRSTVVVGRYSDGEIPWPCVKMAGIRSLVLCGDLVQAVRRESHSAISHWWGVKKGTVAKWRRALGVEPWNEGSRRVITAVKKEEAPLRLWAKGQRAATNPMFRTRLRRRRRRRKPPACGRQWTPAEEALLGTMRDRDLAEKLGCSLAVVHRRRRILGIPSCRGVAAPRNTVAVSRSKLLARRLALGLGQRAVAQRSGFPGYGALERGSPRNLALPAVGQLAAALECRPEDILLRRAPVRRTVPDDALLGTRSDLALARKWRLSFHTVRNRRLELGIPTYLAQSRLPIPDETLLGTRPDAELAVLWGMGIGRVQSRRRKLGIPSFQQSSRWVVSPQQLRACRARAGTTQEDVAAHTGFSLGYFSQVETGRCRTITKSAAERFAAALKCSVADFAAPLLPEMERGGAAARRH